MENNQIDNDLTFINHYLEKGGPADPNEVNDFMGWAKGVYSRRQDNSLDDKQFDQLKKAFGKLHQRDTIWGISYLRPHGYPGDFEVIDMVFNQHINQDEQLKNWDLLLQNTNGLRAVRNRKQFFKETLLNFAEGNNRKDVLNVACGPCRDILEVYEQNPNLNIYFDCLDHDPNAISYAKALLSDKAGDKCRFVNENIFKFKTDKTYDLVWSAGLFDYFDDKTFVTVLKKLYEAVKPGGKLIIGNFSWESETRFLKVFVDWNLNYRANTDLLGLAELAGIDKTKIQIVSESENVNLFMTISK